MHYQSLAHPVWSSQPLEASRLLLNRSLRCCTGSLAIATLHQPKLHDCRQRVYVGRALMARPEQEDVGKRTKVDLLSLLPPSCGKSIQVSNSICSNLSLYMQHTSEPYYTIDRELVQSGLPTSLFTGLVIGISSDSGLETLCSLITL